MNDITFSALQAIGNPLPLLSTQPGVGLDNHGVRRVLHLHPWRRLRPELKTMARDAIAFTGLWLLYLPQAT